MLKTGPTTATATVNADDLEVWRIASRVAEVYGRIAATRRDASVAASDADIAGILDASLLGHEHLRERVVVLLQAGR